MNKSAKTTILLVLAVGGFIAAGSIERAAASREAPPVAASGMESGRANHAGEFLSSHFAQSRYDWKRAHKFLDDVLESDPKNLDLVKRSMILSMGSGETATAALRARKLLTKEPGNALALMIVGVDAFSRGKSDEALAAFDKMPPGDMPDFLKPLLKGWAETALGRVPTEKFNETAIHSFHAALMALLRKDKTAVDKYTNALVSAGSLTQTDAERTADILVAVGDKDKALSLYDSILKQEGPNKAIEAKVKAIRSGTADLQRLIRVLTIRNAVQGAALVMFDMGSILYQEYSDSSADMFLSMSLALDPDFVDAKLLLGDLLSRNGRDDEAISYYLAVPPDNENYMESRRHAAELTADSGRLDDALALLNRLFSERNDVESLIRIGDLYRQAERYAEALTAYNRAGQFFGGKVPEEYWYLLYARGMAYEREGDWNKAEADLKTALSYRPEHPYLMNYLGYGWADKGVNLDQSLALVQKAASLRPSDGFITDSLGWVLYMMGRYKDAVPALEKAVELLPYDPTINDHLGDAYWRVGRRLEAHFQWERAINNTRDEALKQAVGRKLAVGLVEPEDPVKEAGVKTR